MPLSYTYSFVSFNNSYFSSGFCVNIRLNFLVNILPLIQFDHLCSYLIISSIILLFGDIHALGDIFTKLFFLKNVFSSGDSNLYIYLICFEGYVISL